MSKPYIYSFTEPINPEALRVLLGQTDWADTRSPLDIQRMLDRSQITLGVWNEDRLIAFSRVITDDMYRALIGFPRPGHRIDDAGQAAEKTATCGAGHAGLRDWLERLLRALRFPR